MTRKLADERCRRGHLLDTNARVRSCIKNGKRYWQRYCWACHINSKKRWMQKRNALGLCQCGRVLERSSKVCNYCIRKLSKRCAANRKPKTRTQRLKDILSFQHVAPYFRLQLACGHVEQRAQCFILRYPSMPKRIRCSMCEQGLVKVGRPR